MALVRAPQQRSSGVAGAPRVAAHLAGFADRADLTACADGCPVALERIYARHAASCLGLARSMLRDEHMAQDAVQEVFLDLWRGAAKIDTDRSSVGAWLTMLTRRRAIDRIRREQCQPVPMAKVPDAASPDDVARLGQDHVLGAALVSVLRSMPEGPRRSLVLAYWGGYTMNEIAQITDAPVGTVKSRVRRALQCLRSELDVSQHGLAS